MTSRWDPFTGDELALINFSLVAKLKFLWRSEDKKIVNRLIMESECAMNRMDRSKLEK